MIRRGRFISFTIIAKKMNTELFGTCQILPQRETMST